MNTPSERPNKWEKLEGEPLFITVSKDDEGMNEAFQKAKTSFAQFLKAIKSDRFASAVTAVKIEIRDERLSQKMSEDRFAYLWVRDVKEETGGLRAKVVELPRCSRNSSSGISHSGACSWFELGWFSAILSPTCNFASLYSVIRLSTRPCTSVKAAIGSFVAGGDPTTTPGLRYESRSYTGGA